MGVVIFEFCIWYWMIEYFNDVLKYIGESYVFFVDCFYGNFIDFFINIMKVDKYMEY